MDTDRLKASWARVASFGDQVPLRFYSRLFVAHPETRDLFPLSMAAQRDKLVAALGHTVSHVDDLETLTPFLQQLGRDHRKFGTVAEHYGPVGQALLDTLADFLDEAWTPDLAQEWTEAYGLVAKVMIDAAEQAAAHTPAWWDAEIVAHERRTFDIAVLSIQPEPAYEYLPGQSMAVESPLRPRLWRHYSPANAPRPDGTVDLHIRRQPGGAVSGALVDEARKGDTLRLGAPLGHRLVLRPADGRDLLLIAGGTGLAPLKALVEQVARTASATGTPRHVHLFVGARTERELYDLDDLGDLAARHQWLNVVPAVEDEGPHGHEIGPAVQVALEHGPWADHAIAVCGSDGMVQGTLNRLHDAGYPIDQTYFEGFQGLGGDTYGVTTRGDAHDQ